MNTITQTMRFRQAIIEYSFKNGVTIRDKEYRLMLKLYLLLVLSVSHKAKSFINIPPLMNIQDFAILKHLRSKVRIARRCLLSICRKDFRLKLSVFRQITVMSLPKFWATQKIRSRQCLKTNSNNTVYTINSSDRIHPGITARLSVHTVRITNIFMLRIKFYSVDGEFF